MSSTIVITDPARTHTITELRLDLQAQLRDVDDHIETYMTESGDGTLHRVKDGRPIPLVDALDTLERCRWSVEALIGLGIPDYASLRQGD